MGFIRDKETNKIIDKERNAELISVMGYSSGHKEWKINWGDESFKFTAKDTMTYGGERQNTPIAVEWFVESMKIPESLADKKSKLLAMVKEALEAKGVGARFKGPAVVKFHQRFIR